MYRLLIVFALAWTPGHALAQAYFCDRPSEPSIPSPYFAESYQMTSARDEVESYSRDMRDYIECLSNEADDAVTEQRRIVDEWNNTVNTYNLR